MPDSGPKVTGWAIRTSSNLGGLLSAETRSRACVKSMRDVHTTGPVKFLGVGCHPTAGRKFLYAEKIVD